MRALSRSGRKCKLSTAISLVSLTVITGCQSGGNTAALESTAAQTPQTQQQIAATESNQPQQGALAGAEAVETVSADQQPQENTPILAAAQPAAQPVAQCSIQLAGGPPPKPPRGKDFGQAVAKNTGKAVQRGVIRQIGARLGGGLGAAVAGGVAQSTIRQEEDIKGVWMISDANQSCACEVSIDSIYKLKGKGADSGFSKNKGCSSPLLQQVAAWTLGYSFTGYDSKLQLKAKDKTTVIGTFNRDGIHYFSGTLSDGTPVTLWREGQTYNKLNAFNRTAK